MGLIQITQLMTSFWRLNIQCMITFVPFANSTHEPLSTGLSLSLCLSDPLKCDAEITTHCLDNACLFALSVGQFACRTSGSDLILHTHTQAHHNNVNGPYASGLPQRKGCLCQLISRTDLILVGFVYECTEQTVMAHLAMCASCVLKCPFLCVLIK